MQHSSAHHGLYYYYHLLTRFYQGLYGGRGVHMQDDGHLKRESDSEAKYYNSGGLTTFFPAAQSNLNNQ